MARNPDEDDDDRIAHDGERVRAEMRFLDAEQRLVASMAGHDERENWIKRHEEAWKNPTQFDDGRVLFSALPSSAPTRMVSGNQRVRGGRVVPVDDGERQPPASSAMSTPAAAELSDADKAWEEKRQRLENAWRQE